MNRIPENLRRRKDNRPNRFYRARVIEKCRCARRDDGRVPRARGGAAFFSSGALAVGDLLHAIVAAMSPQPQPLCQRLAAWWQMVPVLAPRMMPMSWLLLPSEIHRRT